MDKAWFTGGMTGIKPVWRGERKKKLIPYTMSRQLRKRGGGSKGQMGRRFLEKRVPDEKP